jgi:FkbM family methyltransferase
MIEEHRSNLAANVKLKIRQLILTISGKVKHFKKGIKLKSEWYGNDYGGFYVYPQLLNENSIVYSFGIGEDISFDTAIIQNHHCKVFGFDPTPKSINWINKQDLPQNFTFFDWGISDKSGLVDFYLPKNPEHVSGSVLIQDNININEKITVKMKSINDVMNKLGHQHIDVLKMDIEGAEYQVIESVLNSSVSVDQILIEFHDRFIENEKSKSRQAIEKLNKNGYEIFAISETFEEVSFIRKDSVIKV